MGFGSFAKKALGSLGGGMSGGLFGGLGSGLLGGAFSFLDGANDYYWNRKNMDYQNNLMISNWNMQNAYNHPAAQMARFREAGLNPNLIYGQTNMAGSVGTPSAGGSPSAIMSNIVGREQVRNMRAQNNNLVQQNDNLHAQSVLTREQAEALRIQNKLRLDAGPLADAPWYMRMIYRALPASWKLPNGDLNFGRLSDADISRVLVSGLTGAMSLPNGFLNPVYGTQSYPPVGYLTYGDRGR